ncbi:MAG: Polyphosphate kinase 2 (PPK2) [Bacteroidetes bacterium ADurb.BinA261]|jgi:PPK2 family polyphosphate:nucleotide phosphotransferase|nr:MAG: Polyphosphate kinase 2 (PPK2) [Bacteroidetes bacterium ADurb.BinA261]HQG07923.1 polyphosphate kinase 2 family protein [Dysgonamonadaceae bacterium]HQI43410.1 polyphosphate kinase 2 family protein [Dysgonamonadaceae bacterium]
MNLDYNKLRVNPGSKVDLKDYSTSEDGGYTKETAKQEIKRNINDLNKYQEMFYADDSHSMLIILQAPDAAGKDGVIRHVMSGINPQGCRVHSFKTPSKNELEHDYMWRHYLALPERGMIEIFNRSHYENVLATKVNPEWILNERIPGFDSVDKIDKDFWERRYKSINAIEKHWVDNGMVIVKFFLHLSKDEQKQRFLDRLDDPDKNWKFSSADLKARAQWKEYRHAYEEMLENTSTDYAPWYVIPADKKFFARVAVGDIIIENFKRLNMGYPQPESPEMLAKARETLMNE